MMLICPDHADQFAKVTRGDGRFRYIFIRRFQETGEIAHQGSPKDLANDARVIATYLGGSR